MPAIPVFEIGVWNAWIFVVPYLLVNFVLPFLSVRKKSTFWVFPPYTRLEKMYLVTQQALMGFLLIYSIFLPLVTGTAWFYVGLLIYLVVLFLSPLRC